MSQYFYFLDRKRERTTWSSPIWKGGGSTHFAWNR